MCPSFSILLAGFLISGIAFCQETKKEILDKGTEYTDNGSYSDAIACFNKAIEIDPGSSKAYFGRGKAYFCKTKYDLAIPDFDKAIEIDPKYAEAYESRAISYYYKRDYDMAWKDVYKAKELGTRVDSQFLFYLKKASDREK